MIKQVLISALFVFSASSVFAANVDDKSTVLDINNDGLISKDEAKVSPTLSKQWDKLDTNQDGTLDAEELAMFNKKQN